MTAPAPDLQRRRREMMGQFKEFRSTITKAYDEVAAAMERGEYAVAANLMQAISQSHARASINMRTVLVKHGFLAREATDE